MLTHTQILERVWGSGYANETQNLRVYVSQLRRKLDPDSAQPQVITTEPGVGYRFIADEVQDQICVRQATSGYERVGQVEGANSTW